MKNLLYIGNKLSHYGYTKGVIETLGLQFEKEGFSVRYAGTRKKKMSRLLEMLKAIILNSKRVDFVLIDTYSTSAFWYSWLSGILCRFLDINYIHILHGGNLPLRLKSSRWFCNKIFLHSYANVAVSDYLKVVFSRSGYSAIVIPNNVDISGYNFIIREYLRPRLLWVRSFHRQYNPNMAANVLSFLLKVFPDAELCMIGPDKDGSMREFKAYCEKLGILQHVKITGLLSKLEWHKLSNSYDIFINTTNVDNTPVSVIEAMALGLPVISTNVDGLPYLLHSGNNAILVPKGDAEKMAEEIISLISNPITAHKIAINARLKAESFDWKVIRELWFKLLNETR